MTVAGAGPGQHVPGAAAAEPRWRGLDPGLLRLRRLETVVVGGGVVVLTAVASAVAGRTLTALAVLVVGALLVALLLRVARRQFEAWSWAERDDDLLLRRGVLLRRTTVVPYGRMQYVDVTAGPLDRRFGLATVVLHTAAAASDASIPGLATAEADRLRDRLAALGEARAAGV